MTSQQLPRRTISRIVKQYGGSDIRVFGSVARGEASKGSDLDLLIKLERGRSLLQLIAMKQDLEDILGCKVDIVTEAGLSPFMRDRILSEAVPL
ncbi:MAG: nucleotidyltransferase family protein [Calditrichota bacterium]